MFPSCVGGDGQDLVACWTKGCYVCRRRVSETNQLSTVSRPRAELSSNPTSKTHCNDIGVFIHNYEAYVWFIMYYSTVHKKLTILSLFPLFLALIR